MSYETLLYVWDTFTFIIFFVVLLSSLQNKNDISSNKGLILVSLFLSLGLFLFYREQYLLYQEKKSFLLTFFTYFFTSFSHFLIVVMIVKLYTKGELSVVENGLILMYGFVVGIAMAINVYAGSFLSTHVLIGIINTIPLTYLVHYVIRNDREFYKNIFLIQVFMLLVVYIVKTVNIINNFEIISFTTVNYHDIGMLMIANVIIFSFIVSYLIVKNSFVNQELLKHKLMIEASLSTAITLSEKDTLTGLYNRRKIYDVIHSYYQLDLKQRQVFSIILADVDNFKDVNDMYGHNVGDDVLTYIGKMFQNILREHDVVSRWGGDEFLLLLPNTDVENCKHVVVKIKSFFSSTICEFTNSYISLSCGFADSRQSDDIESLLYIADQNMYSDKS